MRRTAKPGRSTRNILRATRRLIPIRFSSSCAARFSIASIPTRSAARARSTRSRSTPGYRAHVVYAFVRKLQRLHPDTGRDVVLATKGLKGWGRPALGMPQLVDIDLDGRKIKEGAKVWGIGTWSLKGSICSDLFLEMPALVEGAPPPARRMGFAISATGSTRNISSSSRPRRCRISSTRGALSRANGLRAGRTIFSTAASATSRSPNISASRRRRRTNGRRWQSVAALPDELTRLDLFTPRAMRRPRPSRRSRRSRVRRRGRERARRRKPTGCRVTILTIGFPDHGLDANRYRQPAKRDRGGVLEVEYAGRKTRFRSLAEMKQTLQMMRDAVAPSSAAPRFSDTIYDRGDC
jgi:hypothetical protein